MTEARRDDANRRAGGIYAALVTARLAEEDRRGSSLQSRGLAVVTTSGTLVTLIGVFTQFKVHGKVLTDFLSASRWPLGLAMAAFVAAAFCGLMANVPRALVRPRLSGIAALMESQWSNPAAGAEKSVALTRARQLQELETANDKLARAVFAGLMAEVLAVGLATVAVLVALW